MKNVHDLLAKLAWDFSPEQLDHLFECFQVGSYFGFFKLKVKLFLFLCNRAIGNREEIRREKFDKSMTLILHSFYHFYR